MNDSINRHQAIEAIACAIWHYPNLSFLSDYDHAHELAEDALKRLSSEESGRKLGKWTATYSDYDDDVWVSWKCSNCDYVRKKGWKHTDDGKKPDALFCEICGTDMRGEQDE